MVGDAVTPSWKLPETLATGMTQKMAPTFLSLVPVKTVDGVNKRTVNCPVEGAGGVWGREGRDRLFVIIRSFCKLYVFSYLAYVESCRTRQKFQRYQRWLAISRR